MNGGRKEDFESMNYDEIQLIHTTYNAYQASMVRMIVENLVKMVGGS